MKLTKELILGKVTELQIFQHYLNTKDFQKNVKSPFSEDKNPSLAVDPKKLKYFCHSTEKGGDCFQLVADINEINCKSDFYKVLHTINTDLNLGLNGSLSNATESAENQFNVQCKQFNAIGLDYWQRFKVAEDVLHRYEVKQAHKVSYTTKHGEPKQFVLYKNVVGFAYYVNDRPKVYIPEQITSTKKTIKKQIYKAQTKEDVFGLKQLPAQCKYIIIAAGEKDCLCAVAHGFNAISLQSEALTPSAALIRDLKSRCEQVFICYDNDDAGRRGAKKLCDRYKLVNIELPDTVNDIADYLPQAGPEAFKQLIETALAKQQSREENPIKIRNGCYFNGKKKLTNFTVNVIALINSSVSKSRRVLEIVADGQSSDPLEMPTNAFTSKQSFKNALAERGNYYFYGADDDLIKLTEFAFADSDITREKHKLGYDQETNSYILSNAVLSSGKVFYPDRFGLLEIGGKGIYLPCSSILAENEQNAKVAAFRYTKSNVTFQDWYQAFELAYGKRSLLGLSFLIASIHFDIVTQEVSKFPLMCAFGRPKCGKSTFADSLSAVFGSDTAFGLANISGPSAISSEVSKYNNRIVRFEEYENKLAAYVHDVFKNFFDLIGRTKKAFTNDDTTYTTPVNSACLLVGQQQPLNEALASRCISLEFKLSDKSPEGLKAVFALQALENKGLGNVLKTIFGTRSLFKQRFKAEFDSAMELLTKLLIARGISDVDSRTMISFATLLGSLAAFAGDEIPIPTNYTNTKNGFVDLFLDQIEFQLSLEGDSDEIRVFWEALDSLASKGYRNGGLIENVDFRVDLQADTIAIKPSVFGACAKQVFVDTGRWGLPKSVIAGYLKNEPYFIEQKTVKFLASPFEQKFKDGRNAYIFQYSALPVSLHTDR